MKKIIILVLTFVSSLTISAADLTARCFITLTSNNGGTDVIKIFENPDYDNTYVNGVDALKNMNSGNATNLNIYSVQGTTDVSEVRTDAIKDLPIIVETNEVGTTFTMTFNYVIGTIKLYDLVADPTGANPKTLATGDTYEFTVDPAARQTIADRFVLNYTVPAPATPSICFSNNVLDVIGYAGKNLSVKKTDGTDVIAEQVLASDAEHFDLKTLVPADTRLVVTLDGTAYQIDVNPTVSAYTPVVP